jgi:hypothetical protein
LLEPGETCAACAADCTVHACKAKGTHTFAVSFTPPEFEQPSTAAVVLSYRTTHASLPGKANDESVRNRVRVTPANVTMTVNDLDYALRAVFARAQGLAEGSLFSVRFDGCAGAKAPQLSDLACTVDGCAGENGPVAGCRCSVVAK